MRGSLRRKLLRDIGRSKASFGAALLVVVLGVTLLGTSYASYRNLLRSYEHSYDVLHFADFVSTVSGAAVDLPGRLRNVPGAAGVEARLVGDLPAIAPDGETSGVVARIISVPAPEHPSVNDVFVFEGSYLSGADGEVLVESSFASQYGLRPGDAVQVMSRGAPASLTIVGLVKTAEYILPAKSKQDFLPSPKTFAVMYASHATTMELLDPPAPFSEVAVRLKPGADRDAAIEAVRTMVAPAAVTGTLLREDQPSNAALKLDLDGFQEIAIMFPALFFAAAAVTLTILLGRMVQGQTHLIGLMRAIGYSQASVMAHYTAFGLLLGVAGAAIGSVFGFLLADVVTRFYAGIINVPFLLIEPEWTGLAAGSAGALTISVGAALLPAIRASRIQPAEAMRGEVGTATGRAVNVGSRWPVALRIAVRNVLRNRLRSLYTAGAVASAAAVVVVSIAFIDTMNSSTAHEFDDVSRYDVLVEFAAPVPDSVVRSVARMDGVADVAPMAQLPVELRAHGEHYSTMFVGLPPGAGHWNLFDEGGRLVTPGDGLLVASGLKGRLGIEVGDEIELAIGGQSFVMPVAGFVSQSMGSSVYTSLPALQQRLGLDGYVGGLTVVAEPGAAERVAHELGSLPRVAHVTTQQGLREAVDEIMGLFYGFIGIMIVFAALLAFAVVFNTVTVSVVERRRELATMRMIGASLGRVGAIVTIENVIIAGLGMVLGLAGGRLLAGPAVGVFNSDTFSMGRTVVEPLNAAILAAGLMLVVLLSGLPGVRYIGRMQLSDVARERTG